MPRESLFLIARFPGDGLVMAPFTVQHPGSRIDSASVPAGAGFLHASANVVRGMPKEAFLQLHRASEARYGPSPLTESDDEGRRWVFLNRVREDDVAARQLLFLSKLQKEFGLWWSHISAGRYELRAEVADPMAARNAIERLRAHYKRIGAVPDITVAPLPSAELDIRDELRAFQP